MDLGYIAPCPVCGGKIKLYSHCGKPDCKAVCQSCKKRVSVPRKPEDLCRHKNLCQQYQEKCADVEQHGFQGSSC